jgi:hypothetical protein
VKKLWTVLATGLIAAILVGSATARGTSPCLYRWTVATLERVSVTVDGEPVSDPGLEPGLTWTLEAKADQTRVYLVVEGEDLYESDRYEGIR